MNYGSNKKNSKRVNSPLLTPTTIYDSIVLKTPQPQQNTLTYQCAVCNKPTKMHCSKCLKVYYCGTQHQKLHWPKHKKECNKSSLELVERNFESIAKNEIPIEEIFFYNTKNINDNNEFNLEMLEIQKKTYLKNIIQFFSENSFEKSLISCKMNFLLSKEIFREKFNPNSKNFTFLLNYLTDGLLYVRSLIKSDKIDNARKCLLICLKIFLKYFDETEIFHIEQINNISVMNKKQILKKYTNFIATFAALFSAIGDFKNSEILYIKYIRMIENNLGSMSLDNSNCYFLMALFYYHQGFYKKSLECFKFALYIRIKHYGEKHESVADCWFNMAIIYKILNKNFKAIKLLEKALYLRKQIIGDFSISYAQTLEVLGKFFIEEEDLKSGLNKFYECLEIRQKIFRKNNAALKRINQLIHETEEFLRNKIEDATIDENNNTKKNGNFSFTQIENKEKNFESTQESNTNNYRSNLTFYSSKSDEKPKEKFFPKFFDFRENNMRSTKKDLGLVETIKGTETLNLKEPFDKKSILSQYQSKISQKDKK